MKHITILSDTKYLAVGVTCIRSLSRTTSIPLTIHYYCVDTNTYNSLTNLSLNTATVQVVAYPPDSLYAVQSDKSNALRGLQTNDYRYFLWTLASYFSDYIMKRIDQSVTYIDSDIWFHKDINLIYHQIGDRACGIFKHRFLDDGRPDVYGSGKYNVGVVYFNNNVKGKYLLDWWSDAVVYKKYPEYATCGDQKYLEYFTTVCDATELYIDDNIGHGAPWDWQVYNLSQLKNGTLIWNGKHLPHVFSHFSKFRADCNTNMFECISPSNFYCPVNENNVAYQNKDLLDLHRAYFQDITLSDNMLTHGRIKPIKWGLSKSQ